MQAPVRSFGFKNFVAKIAPLLVCLGLFHVLGQVNALVSRYQPFSSSFIDDVKRIKNELCPLISTPDKLKQIGIAELEYIEGMAYAGSNDYERARKEYDKAVIDSEAAIGRLTAGTFLFEIGRARFEKDTGHYDESARLLSELASYWKNGPVPYNYFDARDDLAETLQLQGNTGASREMAERNLEAIQHLDDRPGNQRRLSERIALWRLINCYSDLKQYQACAETYSKLMELDKKMSYGNSEVIESLIALGEMKMWFTRKFEYVEVLLPFQEALQLDPLNVDASYYGMYTCLWANRYQEAFIWSIRWIICGLVSLLLTSFLGIARIRSAISEKS